MAQSHSLRCTFSTRNMKLFHRVEECANTRMSLQRLAYLRSGLQRRISGSSSLTNTKAAQKDTLGRPSRPGNDQKKTSTQPNARQEQSKSQLHPVRQKNTQQYSTDRKLSKRENKRAASEPPQRLHKVLSSAGVASKRASETLIQSGVVTVNGKVILVPQHMVVASIDEIKVRGKPLPNSVKRYYFAVNKPKGYLCSNVGTRPEGEQRLVVDLFKPWIENEWQPKHTHPNAIPPRFFTVGRLDVPTTGLLFVTNDGSWSQKVQHPSNGLTKEYVATTSKIPTKKQLEGIAAGTHVNGAFVQPKLVSPALQEKSNKIRIVLGEGRNREVRVLLENVGLEVTGLKRIRIGGYRLPSDLSIGEIRELRPQLVSRVTDRAIEMNPESNRFAM